MPLSDKGKHPLRQRRKRTKGWRKPSGAVCVSRPSQFGNPFPVVKENPLLAVTRFETYVLPDLDVSGLRGKVSCAGAERTRHAMPTCWRRAANLGRISSSGAT